MLWVARAAVPNGGFGTRHPSIGNCDIGSMIREARRICSLDNDRALSYFGRMVSLVRTLVVALLIVFSASSVVYATNATTMAVRMALADSGPANMAGCTDCDEDRNGDMGGVTCDIACTPPIAADLGTVSSHCVPVAVSTAAMEGVYGCVGRTGPPDPYPPRPFI